MCQQQASAFRGRRNTRRAYASASLESSENLCNCDQDRTMDTGSFDSPTSVPAITFQLENWSLKNILIQRSEKSGSARTVRHKNAFPVKGFRGQPVYGSQPISCPLILNDHWELFVKQLSTTPKRRRNRRTMEWSIFGKRWPISVQQLDISAICLRQEIFRRAAWD